MFGMSKAGAAGKKATAKAASKKPVLVSVTVKLEASQRDKLKARLSKTGETKDAAALLLDRWK